MTCKNWHANPLVDEQYDTDRIVIMLAAMARRHERWPSPYALNINDVLINIDSRVLYFPTYRYSRAKGIIIETFVIVDQG